MKLWRIADKSGGATDYDCFDSAVVAAETEEEARAIHPGGPGRLFDSSWVPVEHVNVYYLGTAKRGTKAGVIVASFNAG